MLYIIIIIVILYWFNNEADIGRLMYYIHGYVKEVYI